MERIYCDTINMVVWFEYGCRSQHTGCIVRILKTMLNEHIRNICKKFMSHCVSAYFHEKHENNPDGLKPMGICWVD